MKVSYLWWAVMPIAFWMACEWWRREDHSEWWDWIEDGRTYEPSPLLDATWKLWVKLRPLWEWVSHQANRPYCWAIRQGWVHYQPDETLRDWCGRAMSPEEMLLTYIEWDMDPKHSEIRATWETYLKSCDDPHKAEPPEDEHAA